MTVSNAVSWLFVPGSRPERFDKAAASGAHEVILDLEDSVRVSDKETAREAARRWLASSGRAWIRINAAGTAWFDGDLSLVDTLEAVPGFMGVVLPKSDLDSVSVLAESVPATAVVALIENARGVLEASAVAGTGKVARLAFGAADYAADLGSEDVGVLNYARHHIALASSANGLPRPIDGVTLTLRDPAVVQRDAATSRGLGYGGKLCVHPAQVPEVHAAFAPTETEVTWARRVVAAVEAHSQMGDPVDVDGQMVDAPVLARARQLLEHTTARREKP